MTTQDNLIIAAQIPGQKNLQPGIHATADQVIGFDSNLGLIAIATSPLSADSSPARIAIEILMDDMQTNIPQLKTHKRNINQASLGANCLRESLENINEFLYEKTASQFDTTHSVTTSITALQLLNGHLSYLAGPGQTILLFKNNNLKRLSNIVSRPIGDKPNYNSEIQQEVLSLGDILILTSIDDIKSVEEDFLRLTLSRFPENLDTVLRQINTKISHTGASQIPSIIICRVNQDADLKKSWISKFRSR